MPNSPKEGDLGAAREFPILTSGRIHLNHAGVAPLTARARDAMIEYARAAAEEFDIRSHAAWFARIDAIRAEFARLIGSKPTEIAFVKNTTQGLQIVADSVGWKPGDCIVVEETTFPSNWYVWKSLEARCGVRVLAWPERAFRYELEDLAAILRGNRVRMVSLSSTDYATGFRHDLAAAGRMAKEYGALFCLDGIQTLGAFEMDVEACGADFVSADGHKWLLGPEGAGVFYARQGLYAELNDSHAGWLGRRTPMNMEARDLPPQESAKRFEEGALNVGGLLGLGASLEVLMEAGIEAVTRGILRNRRCLIERMRELGWETISPLDDAHAGGQAAFRREGVDCARLARGLNEAGVTCIARRGFLRLSPHYYQPVEQMEEAVEKVRMKDEE